MTGRFHRLVDEQDLAVLADVEGEPQRHPPALVHHAVSFGRLPGRIAEDGIIQIERLGKFCIRFVVVATGGEVGRVELPKVIAALTERNAFLRSATGERFRVPGDHHRLFAFEVRQLVDFSVTAG